MTMKKKMDSKDWLALIGFMACLALLGLFQEFLLQLPWFVGIPLSTLAFFIFLYLVAKDWIKF